MGHGGSWWRWNASLRHIPELTTSLHRFGKNAFISSATMYDAGLCFSFPRFLYRRSFQLNRFPIHCWWFCQYLSGLFLQTVAVTRFVVCILEFQLCVKFWCYQQNVTRLEACPWFQPGSHQGGQPSKVPSRNIQTFSKRQKLFSCQAEQVAVIVSELMLVSWKSGIAPKIFCWCNVYCAVRIVLPFTFYVATVDH